jgi:hypothetical protein
MDNPGKRTTYSTQDEEKQNKAKHNIQASTNNVNKT